jgi:flavin reductase (DIM6/NTAB) family NADH-FMN oxidoreductase RutF
MAPARIRIMLPPVNCGGKHMHFDLAQLPETDAYKLIVATVVPRPIALATTIDGAGRVNAAPFSFFNVVSSVPPVVVLGISPGGPGTGGYKDTARNIRDSGEFVVNLVDEDLARQMNHCAVDFPADVGELEKAELTALPSVGVRPPRIAASPVSFECRRITGLSLGRESMLEIGRVIHIHIRDDLVDRGRLYVHAEKMRLVGRMHGRGWYARTTDLFEMPRLSLEDWEAGKR